MKNEFRIVWHIEENLISHCKRGKIWLNSGWNDDRILLLQMNEQILL